MEGPVSSGVGTVYITCLLSTRKYLIDSTELKTDTPLLLLAVFPKT